MKRIIRLGLTIYLIVIMVAGAIRPRRDKIRKARYTVLLTGNFYSENWIKAQLTPIAGAESVEKIIMVAESDVPTIKKVVPCYPHPWLAGILGRDIGRLAAFFWIALKERPDIVGGFHLLVNGLTALLVSKLTGARSLYICGGGVREVDGGGFDTENRIFSKLKEPDRNIEQKLITAVRSFDIVIVRGKNAKRYFLDRKSIGNVYVASGGIDGAKFFPAPAPRTYDLIFVGRLSSVKRVDILIKAINIIHKQGRQVNCVIVGDGPLKEELEGLAETLIGAGVIEFVGQKNNVEEWLRQSKIFLLTSVSEGRSLAMMEAMLCGCPAIVSNVGDLHEMVDHGHNGFLVDDLTPDKLAEYIEKLLADEELRSSFSRAAFRKAQGVEIKAVAGRWDEIISDAFKEKRWTRC